MHRIVSNVHMLGRFRNYLKRFNITNPELFLQAIDDAGACIAGSFMLSFMDMGKFMPNDIDIFHMGKDNRNMLNLNEYPDFVGDIRDSINTEMSVYPAYDWNYLGKFHLHNMLFKHNIYVDNIPVKYNRDTGLAFYVNAKYNNNHNIDYYTTMPFYINYVNAEHIDNGVDNLMDFVNGFDMDICKIMYYQGAIHVPLVDDEPINLRYPNVYSPQDAFVAYDNNENGRVTLCLQRIKKYIERGYSFTLNNNVINILHSDLTEARNYLTKIYRKRGS